MIHVTAQMRVLVMPECLADKGEAEEVWGKLRRVVQACGNSRNELPRNALSFWKPNSAGEALAGRDEGRTGGMMGKRRMILFVVMMLFGLLPIIKNIGSHRFQGVHGSDLVQIVGSGLCFGFGFGVLVGGRKSFGS